MVTDLNAVLAKAFSSYAIQTAASSSRSEFTVDANEAKAAHEFLRRPLHPFFQDFVDQFTNGAIKSEWASFIKHVDSKHREETNQSLQELRVIEELERNFNNDGETEDEEEEEAIPFDENNEMFDDQRERGEGEAEGAEGERGDGRGGGEGRREGEEGGGEKEQGNASSDSPRVTTPSVDIINVDAQPADGGTVHSFFVLFLLCSELFV